MDNASVRELELGGAGGDDDSVLYRHGGPLTALLCAAYLLVFLVGLMGNLAVVLVVLRSPRMRTVTNYFIVNLAVADMLVLLFCLPATLLSNIFVPWLLGWLMCKTVPYVQGLSVAASVYSLVAVSFDRFLAIWWPLKCQITKRRARVMICGIWLWATLVTAPWVVFFELVRVGGAELCLDVWPSPLGEALYFVVGNLVLCYALPTAAIAGCYLLIWVRVRRRAIPGEAGAGGAGGADSLRRRSAVKVLKLLVGVVVVFVACWSPLYGIFARVKLGGELGPWERAVFPVAVPVAQWLGAANSCLNPLLYAFFHNKYRRGFLALLHSRSCCSRLPAPHHPARSCSSSTRKSDLRASLQQPPPTAPPPPLPPPPPPAL